MPFKMISPLKRMATTAIKKLTDLSGDGKTTQKDLLIARGVLNPDGTKVKSPKVKSPNKITDTTGFYKKLGDATLNAIGSGASSIGSYMMSRSKATSPSGKTKKEKEKEKKDKQREPFYPTPDGKFPIPKSLQIKVGKGGNNKSPKKPFYPTPDGKLPKVTTKPPKKATGGSSTPPKSDTAAGDNLKRIAEEVRKRKAAQNKKELAPTGRRVSETVKPPKKLASAENIQKLATGKKRMQGMKDQAKRMTKKSNLRDEIKKLRESDTKKGRKKTFNTAASKEAGKKISNQELIKQKKKKKRELAKKIRKYRRDPNTLKVSKAKK